MCNVRRSADRIAFISDMGSVPLKIRPEFKNIRSEGWMLHSRQMVRMMRMMMTILNIWRIEIVIECAAIHTYKWYYAVTNGTIRSAHIFHERNVIY